jgi:drug/metabolite transporter (DMT)-like permease
MESGVLLLAALVLTGAAMWGGVNVAQGYLLRGKSADREVMVVATAFGAVVSSLGIQFTFFDFPAIGSSFWLPFLVTALLNILIQNLDIKAKQIEDVSIVVPLASTSPVFLLLTSYLILGEWPSVWGYYGVVLVAVGSYVLNLKGTAVALPRFAEKAIGYVPAPGRAVVRSQITFYAAPLLRIANSLGARIAVFVAILGSIAIVFDKMVVVASSPMIHTAAVFAVVGIVTLLMSKWSGRWHELDKRLFLLLFGIGCVIGVMNVFMNAGYLFGIALYVGTLKRTQIFFTVIFSAIFLKEQYAWFRLYGSLIIFFGVLIMLMK